MVIRCSFQSNKHLKESLHEFISGPFGSFGKTRSIPCPPHLPRRWTSQSRLRTRVSALPLHVVPCLALTGTRNPSRHWSYWHHWSSGHGNNLHRPDCQSTNSEALSALSKVTMGFFHTSINNLLPLAKISLLRYNPPYERNVVANWLTQSNTRRIILAFPCFQGAASVFFLFYTSAF